MREITVGEFWTFVIFLLATIIGLQWVLLFRVERILRRLSQRKGDDDDRV